MLYTICFEIFQMYIFWNIFCLYNLLYINTIGQSFTFIIKNQQEKKAKTNI